MKKFAYIFPGQSSQRIGMLNELYKESLLVRRTFEEASDIMGVNFPRICFEGEKDALRDISISAPAIITACTACFKHVQDEYGVSPALMAGHSLGEYAALTCAQVFTLDQVLPLVTYRSKLAQRITLHYQGVMSVIFNVNSQRVEELCREMQRKGRHVWVSCNNWCDQVCVAGKQVDVSMLEQRVVGIGASYKRIEGNAPFHTPLMKEAAQELTYYLKECKINSPKYPVVANATMKPYTVDSVIDNLVDQLTMPVRWFSTINYFKRQHIHTYIELGSGHILSRLMKSNDTDVHSFSYEKSDERRRLMNHLVEREVVSL